MQAMAANTPNQAGNRVPETAKVVRLYKHGRDGALIACVGIEFAGGAPAIDTALRRAAISGYVEVGGQLGDYFADLLDANGDIVENVALDRASYGALKNRWMRTTIDRTVS